MDVGLFSLQCPQIEQHRAHVEDARARHEAAAGGIDLDHLGLEQPDDGEQQHAGERREYEQRAGVAVLEVPFEKILVQMGGYGPQDGAAKSECDPSHRADLGAAGSGLGGKSGRVMKSVKASQSNTARQKTPAAANT